VPCASVLIGGHPAAEKVDAGPGGKKNTPHLLTVVVAFRLLETSYQEHGPWMPYLKVAPFVDELRSDRRFDSLLRLMNFPS